MPTFMHVFDVNVSDVIEKKKEIKSSEFRTAFNDVFFDWQLSFLPRNDDNLPSIILELKKLDEKCSKSIVTVNVSFKFVTTTDSEEEVASTVRDMFGLVYNAKKQIFRSCEYTEIVDYGFNGVVPKLFKIYPGNVFKIVCKLSVANDCFDEFDKEVVERRFLADSAASKLFSKITTDNSDDNFLSDVTLTSSDNVEFKCHRFILCANSTVFNTMFSNKNFQESNVLPYAVNIPDIDGETLKELLRFVYTKNVSVEFNKLAELVLYGSEKYHLQELKSMCEHALKFKLNAENIFDYFEMADKYKLESLKADCWTLFKVYFHLLDEERVTNFFTQYPHLGWTVFRLAFDDDKK